MSLTRVPSSIPAELEQLVETTIGCCLIVHRELGPGMSEGVYSRACCIEFESRGLAYEREKAVPIRYRGALICRQRIDLFVEDRLVIEVKSVSSCSSCLRDVQARLIGLLLELDLLPLPFEFLDRQRAHLAARRRGARLERGESTRELVIRPAQGGLGFDPQLSRQIRDGEQQIPHLFLGPIGIGRLGGERLPQFHDFLVNLVHDVAGPGPIEAGGCGSLPDLVRAEQRGKTVRQASQRGGGLAGGRAIRGLLRIPSRQRRARRRRPFLRRRVVHLAVVLEDVWVPANELVRDRLQRVGDAKCPHVGRDLCEKHPFEDVIANLFPQRLEVVAFNGIDNFVGFFEDELPERLERLFAIPGTPVWRS